MTAEEVGVIARAFVDAARTLQRAGFSGVELHGGHGYLITQFLSPWSNTRDDGYGGDVEGRTRFVRETIAGIRAECGAGFIVGLKTRATSVRGGIDGDEAGRIAARLAAAGGLDYVAFAQGNFSLSLEDHTPDMHHPLALHGAAAAAARARGRSRSSRSGASWTPRTPSSSSPRVSAISSAWGARSSPMRRCPRRRSPGKRPPPVRASLQRAGPRSTSASRSRASTTRTSGRRAKRRGGLAPAARKRRIVVVGSGVAGLEAAWVAASRGHAVTVLGSASRAGKARLESLSRGGPRSRRCSSSSSRAPASRASSSNRGRPRPSRRSRRSSPTPSSSRPDRACAAPATLAADSDAGTDAWTLAAGLGAAPGRRTGTAVLFDHDHGAGVYALADQLASVYDRLVIVTFARSSAATSPTSACSGCTGAPYRARSRSSSRPCRSARRAARRARERVHR